MTTGPLNAVYEDALRLTECGLSVIPIRADGSKAPAVSAWKQFQERRATPAELREWFSSGIFGLAVVNGIVSLNLVTLDFDERGLLEQWLELCAEQELGPLVDTLPIVATPSGGYHVYWRAQTPPPGNKKLAWKANADGKRGGIRIETRAEGGYALIPPSGPACHPAHVPYEYVRNHLALVPTITDDEQEIFLTLAQVFNEWHEPEHVRPAQKPVGGPLARTGVFSGDGVRPGNDYNARGDWAEVLRRHGWTLWGHRAGRDCWRRPGKTQGLSATSGYGGSGAFYVFSSNAAPFDADTSYGPFAVYTLLEHGGDYAAAAKALSAQGYGDPPKPKGSGRAFSDDDVPPSLKGPPLPPDGPQKPPDEEPAPSYHFTDLGNARRLMDRWGRDLRFCHAWGRWLVWDGTCWKSDENGMAQRLARETVRDVLQQAEREPDRARADDLRKWALKCQAANRLGAMEKLAQDEPEAPVRVDEIDAHPMLLNVLNGTICLTNGHLMQHDRDDLCSKIAPVVYDPDAACPLWDKFLHRIMDGDAENIAFLQRAVGFALTGDSRRRVLVILYGCQGRNGKSTFLDTIHALLGDYAMSTPAETIMAKRRENAPTNDIARLRGARFVSASETEADRRLSEALVKQMTGGDMMTARFLNQEFFDFKPEFKIFLATNHKPNIRNGGDGLFDRLALVPFEVRIPDAEVDERLPEKLLEELPGILAWAVRGCLEWQRGGLRLPSAVKNATEEYRIEMDTFGAFLETCCVDLPDNADGTRPRTPATPIYVAYEKWCEESKEFLMSRTAFGRKLGDRGYPSEKIGGVVYRLGLGLLDPTQEQTAHVYRGDARESE